MSIDSRSLPFVERMEVGYQRLQRSKYADLPLLNLGLQAARFLLLKQLSPRRILVENRLVDAAVTFLPLFSLVRWGNLNLNLDLLSPSPPESTTLPFRSR